MNDLFRRLDFLLHRRRYQRELAADMEFHREMAARAGRANFGNDLYLREQARDAWGWTWIDRLGQDLRFAWRMLRKSPGFTLGAVLMLAVGLGVNIAAFAFFELMVLRPLDVRDPATLLRFHRRSPERFAYSLPYPEMAFFREHSRTLSAVIALNSTSVGIDGEEKLAAHFVTGNFFSEIGAAPALGRLIDTRDEAPGAGSIAVLSYSVWERRFGADPLIAGKTIHLNGKPVIVSGVAPRNFGGLSMSEPAMWLPIVQQPAIAGRSNLLTDFSVEGDGVQMWGRLRPGVAAKVAEEELASLAAALRREHPNHIWENESLPSEAGGYAASLGKVNRRGTGAEGGSELYATFAMVAALTLLILAVACANLGSLLLARGVAREREMAVRAAVGAGRARLIRQLFTESLLLAALGSAAGLGLGYVVLRAVMAVSGAPSWLDPTPDWRVVLFAAGVAIPAAVLFGLAPAFAIAQGRRRTMARQFLVGAQVAASCVLLIVAGLLGRALDHAVSANPGFEYEHVLSIDPGLRSHGYSPSAARAYLEALRGRIGALGGVESVALALTPPLGRRSIAGGIESGGREAKVQIHYVDPEFFETMRIPLLRGRIPARGDSRSALVGESLARALWPGEDPLGKTVSLGGTFTVTGVARSVRLIQIEDSDSREVYLPLPESEMPSVCVLVRTAGPPQSMARTIAATVKTLAPDASPETMLMKEGYRRKIRNAESTALAVGLFGGLAHLLACLGIVGVVAYAVSQRTREIGIRMALGAKASDVLSVVLRQFSLPAVAGLVLGLSGAAALSRLLRGQLFGISHLDPAAYLSAGGVFLLTVLIAAVLPARRALRIDPLRALRHE
jgi:predicted permease